MLVVSYVQSFLRKKRFIVPFVDHFRTTTLIRKFRWSLLLIVQRKCLTIALFRLSPDSELCASSSTQVARSCLLLLSHIVLKQFFGKISLTNLSSTWNKLLEHCIFADSLVIVSYVQRVLVILFFHSKLVFYNGIE